MRTRTYALALWALLLAAVVGCDSTPTTTEQPPEEEIPSPPAPTYTVVGSDMSPVFQNIYVTGDSGVVSTATVTLNGVSVPLKDAARGYYQGQLPAAIADGDSVRLTVTIGSQTVLGRGVAPARTEITAPADGLVFDAGQPLTVTWTAATNPDRFLVYGGYSCGTGCGTSKRFDAAGTARSFTIPGGSFPAGTEIELRVQSYLDGVFSGATKSDSNMNFRGNLVRSLRIRTS
ncbi:MAG: hypothetical protein R3E10_12555 [Gemmatimonadota bacterium]